MLHQKFYDEHTAEISPFSIWFRSQRWFYRRHVYDVHDLDKTVFSVFEHILI